LVAQEYRQDGLGERLCMSVDLIRYDLLVQEALRGTVRHVLSTVARDGLPGEHHFYISFRTHARGVRLSKRMRDRYPDEMTVVLQHQFWDLQVSEHAFEVGLSFQNISEMLLVPFDAVTRFADPAVGFELQFAVEEEKAEASPSGDLRPEMETTPRPEPARQLPLLQEEDLAPKSSKPADNVAFNEASATESEPKVISIDAFRKKS
jgi:uncharacterized protein